MNVKMAINSQLSTIESKKHTKQTSRTETESEIWRSFGGLSVGRGQREIVKIVLIVEKSQRIKNCF